MLNDTLCQAPSITLEHLVLGRMTMLPAPRRRIPTSDRLAPEAENALRRSAILSAFGLAIPTLNA